MTKRNRDTQKTKQKLLDTAEEIFVEKGFDGARVDEIAERAGVNKRMIYVWFGNKEQLYLEVLTGGLSRMFNSAPPEPDPEGDPVADTKALVEWYFWFLYDNPSFVRLLGWETLTDGRRAGQVLIDLMGEGLETLQRGIRRGKEKGVFRSDLVVHRTVSIVAEICLGYFSRLNLFEVLWQRDLKNNREANREVLDSIVQFVIHGCLAEKAAGA